MPRIVEIQPGGEKYLGFALSKLRGLKAWMKQAGLRVASKHYWINATDKIWIKARDGGNDIWYDLIRIEAGAAAWQVLVTFATPNPDLRYFLDIKSGKLTEQDLTRFVSSTGAQRVLLSARGRLDAGATLHFVDKQMAVSQLPVGDTFVSAAGAWAVGLKGEAVAATVGASPTYLVTSKKYAQITDRAGVQHLVAALADGEFIYGRWTWDFGGSGKFVDIFRSADMVDGDGDGVNDLMTPIIPIGHLDVESGARATHNDWIMMGVVSVDLVALYRVYGISGKNGQLGFVELTFDPTVLSNSMKSNAGAVYGFALVDGAAPSKIVGFKTTSTSHASKILSISDSLPSFTPFGGSAVATNSNGYYAFSGGSTGALYVADYENGIIATAFDDVGRFPIAAIVSGGTKTTPWWVGQETVDYVPPSDPLFDTRQVTFINHVGVQVRINHGSTSIGTLSYVGATTTEVFVRFDQLVSGANTFRLIGSSGSNIEVRDAVIAHLAANGKTWMSTVSVLTGAHLVFDGKAYVFVRAQGVDPETSATKHALFSVNNLGVVAEYALPDNSTPTTAVLAQSEYDRINVLAS